MAERNYSDLTKTELVQLLQARDRRDATRFGLVWEANEIDRDKALNQDFVALDLDRKISCGAAPWKNLIIEGDNFDALRYLRMTFAGRVKCIYIDPPYNTGNKDFVYNDRFVDKEDLWRHSKWCEFMFQRLTLAKDLLSQDGVIFVSIDDNEVATLRLLMDKIFGSSKLIATLIWKSRQNKDNRNTNGVSNDHEYVIAYGERLRGEDRDLTQYTNDDNDNRGPWTSGNMVGLATKAQRPNLHYDLINPKTVINYGCPEKGWRYSPETMARLIKEERILWPQKASGRPREKSFLLELSSDVTGYSSLIGQGVYTRDGSSELRQIFDGRELFAFPKPSTLIAELLRQGTSDEHSPLIVDFFAGSGTTAHAVHKLNQEDGGNRRVILVSSTEATVDEPKKNICRDVCATRVRRVIEGYGDNPGLGGDFAYLRCRRISPGNLTDVEHEQIWIALQLTHMPSIVPFDEDQKFMVADHDGLRLIYVPHLKARGSQALLESALNSPSTIVYTWQPELVSQKLMTATNTQVEAVPEILAQRFGLRI